MKKSHEKNDMYLFLKKFSQTKMLIQKFIIKYFNKSVSTIRYSFT